MIGYLIFLAFVIMRIAYYIAEPNLTWIDWVILLYVAAMIAEEIYQISNEQTSYFNITNVLDISIILLFSCFFVLRIVGSPAKNLLMMRISEHVFAVAAGISFLRVLHYSQVSRKLGPIQISFIEITTEVVSFVVILGVILVAFALALSGSYTAGVHTADFEKGNISVPHNFNGLWPSLELMYWSLYGYVAQSDLAGEHEVLWLERKMGEIMFALWLLVSAIVLLNMLIALIDAAFDRVKTENGALVWNLAVTNIIRNIKHSPSFPLPVNLVYLIPLFAMGFLASPVHRLKHCWRKVNSIIF
ncbi:short transient receptor potential channel 4-like [Corticium candelabrum]|uniref:short transient receptor potential channel 4-like n=1 Tax=Corticium candelabrum TaxID=121492 RepID=UPI002E26D39E|nr:short transient receptor potential channel 4-like [Corticium candelabrum]